LTHIKGAVLLDAAGTLLTPAEPVGRIYARHARAHGLEGEGEEDLAALFDGRFRAAFSRQALPAYRRGDPDGNEAVDRAWWRDLVGEVCAGLPGLAFDAFFDHVYAAFADAGNWTLYPEVAEVLAALRAEGLKLAVVSNFDRRLKPICDGLGLSAAVDALVWSAAVGVAKPNPGIFAEALERLGVPAIAAVHVGDSPAHDVAGARAAGITPVLIDRGRDALLPFAAADMLPGTADPLVIGSLRALPELLRARRGSGV
jgi:putative hydrolase of the HAD superfamily